MLTCAAAPYSSYFSASPALSHSLSSPFCHLLPLARTPIAGVSFSATMRLLRKQSSFKQHHQILATSSPKPSKPPSRSSSLARSAASYLLREQRLVFLILGILIASSFFLLQAFLFSWTSQTSSRHIPPPQSSSHFSAVVARPMIPIGLRKPPMRVLVTGGSGFVGSHLVDRLIDKGDSVIVVDNFYTGRKGNGAHHIGNPRYELIRHDIVEPILVEVDQIYHLACPASPVHYKRNPIKTITNVIGTLNMLGLAKRTGARFLLTSTSEVYGDALEYPQKENYWGNANPIGVRGCYEEGKRAAETLAMDYHRGAGVQVRIARIFNTYGPRMSIDDGRVVSNFVAQALRREPLTIYGDGNQTRSFQYVSDLIAGLIKLMDGENVGPFNLGNPGEFTMLDLVEVIKETIDPRATVVFKPKTADDPHRRKPDITKAKQLLNWEPKIPLREGLSIMAKDFRRRIQDE